MTLQKQNKIENMSHENIFLFAVSFIKIEVTCIARMGLESYYLFQEITSIKNIYN